MTFSHERRLSVYSRALALDPDGGLDLNPLLLPASVLGWFRNFTEPPFPHL